MAEAKTQSAAGQDPSMEEILQSIRRIIAEEETAPEAENGEYKNGKDISSDVLELTEVVDDSNEPLVLKNEVEESAGPIDVLSSIDNALAEETVVKHEAPPEANLSWESDVDLSVKKPGKIESAPPPPPLDVGLISETAAAEAAAAFRKVPQGVASSMPAPTSSPSFRSGVVVEDLVIELLRPMLKEWMDAHLAGIVERIVEREVKRLSGQ